MLRCKTLQRLPGTQVLPRSYLTPEMEAISRAARLMPVSNLTHTHQQGLLLSE